jgi:MYXO-CTERM domain-containing protein
MPVDAQPPKVILVEQTSALSAADEPVVRSAVSDSIVTDAGARLSRAYVKVDGESSLEVEASLMGGDIYRAVLPAFADATVVSYTACAIDLEDNEGCGQPLSYTVGEPPGTGGAGGAGTGGASSGPGATGSGGADDDGLEVDDDGCGCSLPGRQPDPRALLLLVGIAALALRRRR